MKDEGEMCGNWCDQNYGKCKEGLHCNKDTPDCGPGTCLPQVNPGKYNSKEKF